MRKIVMMLLVLAMTVCGVIGIAACGKDPEPEQNQGQVEQEKDKDKEENKPNQNQGENDKDDEGKEDEGKGDEENENPNTKPGDTNPPETPENQKPNPENPPEEDPKEDDKQDEEDKKDEDNKEEEPPQDEPQGDEPEKDPDEEETDPTPDTPTKPDDKPDDTKPEEKPSEHEKKPEEDKKPDQENCSHKWEYMAVGTDLNTRQHVATCTKCGKKMAAEKCDFSDGYKFVAATCTVDGYNLYTCKVCGEKFESQIWDRGKHKYPATGHKFEGEYTHVPNSNPSMHEQKCSNKGCTATQTVKCQFDSEIKEPTCTENGSSSRICKTCSYKETLDGSSEALGHSLKYEQLGENKHRQYCTREGCHYDETVECILETVSTPATCTKGGSTTVTCKACGRETVTTTYPKGHTFNKEDGSFSSTYKGHTGKCTECNQVVGSTDKLEEHQFGKNNFCLSCGFDGIFANSCYKLEAGMVLSEGNGFLKKLKEAVLAEHPWGETNMYTLTSIKATAFKGCSSLETVYIPKCLYSIEKDAFKDCTNLKKIYFEGSKEQWEKLSEVGLGYPQDVDVQFGKKYEETKTNTVSTVQPVALPAEVGKRVYA